MTAYKKNLNLQVFAESMKWRAKGAEFISERFVASELLLFTSFHLFPSYHLTNFLTLRSSSMYHNSKELLQYYVHRIETENKENWEIEEVSEVFLKNKENKENKDEWTAC